MKKKLLSVLVLFLATLLVAWCVNNPVIEDDLGGNDVHSLIFYVTTCKQKIDNLSFLKNVCKI